jgi:membrane protein required for colicin V production
MTWADYLIIATISLSTLISIWRGFTREALSLSAWVLAAWVALTFSPALAMQLEPHIEIVTLREAAAFAILLIATLFIAAFVNHLLAQLVHKTGLTGTDRTIGILFGVARGVILVAVLVLVGEITEQHQEIWWQDSLLISHFEQIVNWLKQFLPDDLRPPVSQSV